MSSDAELARLVGRKPDARLLGDAPEQLPTAVGRPRPIPPDPRHERIVGLGAALTGVGLIGGSALLVAGIVLLVAGGLHALSVAVLALGALLVSTHWGWVHVAEITAQRLEASRNRGLLDEREAWLAQIEPYARWEVTTSVAPDGAIAIERVRYEPVTLGEDRFTFATTVEVREQHSGDEPGATVAESAELLRRRAAADTERERLRYEAAAGAYEQAVLEHADEQERQAAVRAASQALSDQINSNLREPPLVE
jgi:hypothetical protein